MPAWSAGDGGAQQAVAGRLPAHQLRAIEQEVLWLEADGYVLVARHACDPIGAATPGDRSRMYYLRRGSGGVEARDALARRHHEFDHVAHGVHASAFSPCATARTAPASDCFAAVNLGSHMPPGSGRQRQPERRSGLFDTCPRNATASCMTQA
jgi:hypothetical protein